MAGLEGRTLGRYELRQLIGRGGMADVYLADDLSFSRPVAVKIFKRDDEEMLRRFIREARLMATLRNPHLMPIYDTGEGVIDGLTCYYIAMPYMNGGTLRSRVRRGRLPLNDTCYYMRAIADALDYLHTQGIIHRDIKSSNVLLSSDGACYVSDFGIARMTSEATQLTSTGNVLGTVDYVAPELFEPDRRADALSDLYSLGVLLYELVTGRLPFTGENQIALVAMHVNKQPPSPRLYVPELSPQVEYVILKSLAKQPEQRYQSASALAEAFCQATTTRPTSGVYEQEGLAGAATVVQNDTVPARSRVDRANAPTVAAPYPQPAAVSEARPAQQERLAEGYARQNTPARATPKQIKRSLSPERRRTRVLVILALLALLAVVGPMIAVAVLKPKIGITPRPTSVIGQTATAGGVTNTPVSSPTPNLTATAQAFANATQAADNATATAKARATATVQAHASATAGVAGTATSGSPVYQDALNNPNNSVTLSAQWDENSNCTFKQDGYHVTGSTTVFDNGKLYGCHEAGNEYQNFAAAVDITILSGHSGGLFFRVGIKPFGAYSGYLFEIGADQRYKISASGNFSTGTNNTILQDWTPTSLINKVGTKNTIVVLARADQLSFYVNGSYLTSVQDATFTLGNLAFLATTSPGGADADILYSNLKVYQLS